jgi:MFS family permease
MSTSYNQWADTASDGLQTPLQTPERRSHSRRSAAWSAPNAREFVDDYSPSSTTMTTTTQQTYLLEQQQQRQQQPPQQPPQSSPPNQPGPIEKIQTSCNLRLVVLNASLSSFSSGYSCASIAGAILFLAKDTTFFPLPTPSNSPTFAPSPSSFHNRSSQLYGNDQGSTTIHSCFHPSSSSSSAATSTTPSSSTVELYTLMSDFQRGLLVSCILLSALVGALCASSVADTIGRRPTQIFTNLFFIIGCAGMYFAPNNISSDDDHGYWILVGARSMTGLGVGVSSVLVNLYITEISPAKSRGELGGWAPFAVTAGILTSYVFSSVIGGILEANYAWRIILGVGSLPAFLQMAISLFFEKSLPESPRWLLMHGRPVRAYQSSVLLHGARNKNAIQQELDAILLIMMSKNTGSGENIGSGNGDHTGVNGTGIRSTVGDSARDSKQPTPPSYAPHESMRRSSNPSFNSYSAIVGLDKSWNGGVSGGSTTTRGGTTNGDFDSGSGIGVVPSSLHQGSMKTSSSSSATSAATDLSRQRSESDRIELEILGVQDEWNEVDCCCRLCSRTRYRSAALAGIGINILQQVSGINVVIYFGK